MNIQEKKRVIRDLFYEVFRLEYDPKWDTELSDQIFDQWYDRNENLILSIMENDDRDKKCQK